MNLYLLEARSKVPYDTFDAYVIEADTPTEARLLAEKSSGGEGCRWTSADEAKCTLVGTGVDETRRKARIILGSFNAG